VLLATAAWMVRDGRVRPAVFVALWGVLVVGTVDNVVRPFLISQGADLPFLLIVVGVVGGLLAWGLIGVFLGPTLLAAGYGLLRDWLDEERRPPRREPPG
jgi:predicted PurR-regulated permease PerM